MAKTYNVKKGDTLWSIAKTYSSSISGNSITAKMNTLRSLNGIVNPDLIYENQTLKLSGSAGSSSATNSNTATVKDLKIQNGTSNTLFATWEWSKDYTDSYKTIWKYDTGNNVWFVGSEGTPKHKQETYTIPENATRVCFSVKPISKTKTVNNKETSYWTANWSTTKYFNVKNDTPPQAPSSPPTVTMDGYKLTASYTGLTDVYADGIEFQVVKDSKSSFKTGKAKITTTDVEWSCTVSAGGEYKVRARSYKGSKYSVWTEYSENKAAPPAASKGINVLKATKLEDGKVEVYVDWHDVSGATKYEVEYTTEKRYFGGSENVTKLTDDGASNNNGKPLGYIRTTGLAVGDEYFFRVRAYGEGEDPSAWSAVKSIIIGTKPAAPTTWSSTTSAVAGEEVNLYWVHNSTDGSSLTYSKIEIISNGVTTYYEFDKPGEYYLDSDGKLYESTIFDEVEEGGKTNRLQLNTDNSASIKWRVFTRGITGENSDWSVQRSIEINSRPSLSLDLYSSVDNIGDPDAAISVVEGFPLYIYGLASPPEQAPIGYTVSITSNETYTTVDNIGNEQTINAGDLVYSKFFDVSTELICSISAEDVNLENNMSYTVNCTVAMNTGLTAENSCNFTVSWGETDYQVNAEINYDRDAMVTHIRPYCRKYMTGYFEVEYDDVTGVYSSTPNIIPTEDIEATTGYPLEDTSKVEYYVPDENGDLQPIYAYMYTASGEQVYSTDAGQLYCTMELPIGINDAIVSVYRREYDGTFTEIATGISGNNTFVTDPHPALDYARYRIVAVDGITGAISYYDVPGVPIKESSVIIQWDENWTNFDVNDEVEDALDQPAWSGSLLKLPYNIDVSDSYTPDVSRVEYIGRKHPVSYYGTQLGVTSSWSVEIDKDDKETLYALRRLAVWMGDAYVREPSGSGYWANVGVSFSQTHCEVTIPVTLSITRVEGGM